MCPDNPLKTAPVTTEDAPLVLTRWMTLTEVARLLNQPLGVRAAEMRLRRLIRRREKVLGVEIMQRIGSEASPRYRVTLARLREFCPELFDTRSTAQELVREKVEQIEEELCRLKNQDEAIAKVVLRLVQSPTGSK